MKVKRIMSNTATSDLAKAKDFYGDILGLELLMDLGWFQTYGSETKMAVQVSFATEGGSGTPVPELSIEVDDLQAALARFNAANVHIEYGPVGELGAVAPERARPAQMSAARGRELPNVRCSRRAPGLLQVGGWRGRRSDPHLRGWTVSRS